MQSNAMTKDNPDDLFGPPMSKNPNKGISHEDLWNARYRQLEVFKERFGVSTDVRTRLLRESSRSLFVVLLLCCLLLNIREMKRAAHTYTSSPSRVQRL